MKCPKCGQETVNINNKHICTACGIVTNEASAPKEQILRQIKEKLAGQAPQEKYVSPVELMKEANAVATQPVASALNYPLASKIAVMPKHSIPDFPGGVQPPPRKIETNHHFQNAEENFAVQVGAMQTPDQNGDEKQSIFPNHGNIHVGPESDNDFGSETRAGLPELNIEPIHKEVSPRPISQAQNTVSAIPAPVPQGEPIPNAAQAIPASGGAQASGIQNVAPAPTGPVPGGFQAFSADEETIYPSHQVSPILIKILIFSFVALALFGVVYLLYDQAHIFSSMGNIGQFLGERLFK